MKWKVWLLFLTVSGTTTLFPFNNERFPLGYCSHQVIKAKIEAGDEDLEKEVQLLIWDANAILDEELLSVLDDKHAPARSNPNDYVSDAPYWWPNPETKNRLPYVRKDGEVNLELRNKGDDKRFTKMAVSVHLLSLAYYYTDEEKYAERHWLCEVGLRTIWSGC